MGARFRAASTNLIATLSFNGIRDASSKSAAISRRSASPAGLATTYSPCTLSLNPGNAAFGMYTLNSVPLPASPLVLSHVTAMHRQYPSQNRATAAHQPFATSLHLRPQIRPWQHVRAYENNNWESPARERRRTKVWKSVHVAHIASYHHSTRNTASGYLIAPSTRFFSTG